MKPNCGERAEEDAMAPGTRTYQFEATLTASFKVEGATEAEAEAALRQALDGATAGFGMLGGKPLASVVGVEGPLELEAVDGEWVG